jgi:hypothetical protein
MVAMVTVVAVISVSAIPIVRPVVRVAIVRPVVVIPVRIVVSIRIIPIVARSEPNVEVDLSIGAWSRRKGQAPRHQSNQ